MRSSLFLKVILMPFLISMVYYADSSAALVLKKGTFPVVCPGGAYVTQILPIILKETLQNDINCGAASTNYQYILSAPTGFEFRPGFGDIEDLPSGTNSDFDDNLTITVFSTFINIEIRSDASLNNSIDSIFITNLQIRALTTAPSSGSITRVGGSLSTTPQNTGVSHADITSQTINPFSVSNVSRCGAGNITFTPTGDATIVSYNLYDQITGGTLVNSGTTLTVGLSSTTNYYISAVGNASCESQTVRKLVQGIVNQPINITQNPTGQNICPGATATFSIISSGTPLSYQWQVDPNLGTFSNLINSNFILGATTSTLSITGTSYSMNGYQYRCVVSGGCGTSSFSLPAALLVEAPPAIYTQPLHPTLCDGENTTLSVSANDVTNYQWQLFDGSNWTNLSDNSTYSNVSSATLSISSVNSSMDNNLYRCMLTGDCAQTLTSEIAVLHVTSTCVEFSGLNSKYCLNDEVSALNGFPSGGVFSGPGISVDGMNQYWFDADAIGSPGIKNINYDLTFAGCTFSKTLQTEVKDDCEIVPNDPLPLAPEANKKESEEDVKLIELYPNPTKVSARILNPTGIDITKVILLDAKGNVVWEGLPEANEISLTGLSKGLYSVLLYSTDEVWKEKLVLE